MNKSVVISFLLILLISGCKDYGTEGGNPQAPVSNPTNGIETSESISSELCQSRNRCLQINDELCNSSLQTQTDITNELRINPPYRNLQELLQGIGQNEVTVNEAELKECLTKIANIDCSSQTAQDAFHQDYDDIHLALRESVSCTNIYQTK